MSRKKILKIAASLAGLFVVLFIVLVVHIAIVTNPKDKVHYGIQLSRIDFNTKLDTAQANDVCNYVRSIKGVGSVMYSYEYQNLVFAHQLDIVSGNEVFQQLVSEKHVDAKKFTLTPEEIAKTAKCPVMNDKSILKSLAHKIQVYFL